jgi:UDP-N-acetylglucosamine--N-acetylmuramyl-(pentapeptide) pyrophosphoryl-undecaprenol N-acetylglucosamine transferase
MPLLLSAADITITRSGALTLSELCFVGVAAILVPSPNVTDDHQRKNALVLSKENAAILVEEGADLKQRLEKEIAALAASGAYRRELSRRIGKFAVRDSSQKIYNEIKNLLDDGQAKNKDR